ncbi:MAG: ABC transporter substrate-binding protein, partial [Proteobacteria bacterium]|nr:ABC transporter substrate-binding protein [Pseudomonadota bacterium]
EYNGQKFDITGVKEMGRGQYTVSTQVLLSDGSGKVMVSYRCMIYSGSIIKIRDIISENISLITTQRSEFNSIMGASGIAGLVKLLKNRVTTLENNKK